MSIFNGCGHRVSDDLMVEFLLESNHWDHPFSEAVIVNFSAIGLVPSLDEALVGSSDESSVELRIFKDGFWINIALNFLLWNLSFDWEEIKWSIHGWFSMLLIEVLVMSIMVTMMFTFFSSISMMLMMSVMSMMFVVLSEHLEEVRVSRCGGNAEKGQKGDLVHICKKN